MLRTRLILLFLIALLGAAPAIASNSPTQTMPHNLIRGGGGIGQISIGMKLKDAAIVRHHAPTRSKHLPGGVLVESWLSKSPAPPHIISEKNLLSNYLTLFFLHGKVVQIEVSSEAFYTDSALTTANPADDFRKAYRHFTSKVFQRNIADDVTFSLPAAKHFVAYDDDKSAGIAWKYGDWADMAADPDPTEPLESVIVHLRGKSVIYDPFDSLPYSGTWPMSK